MPERREVKEGRYTTRRHGNNVEVEHWSGYKTRIKLKRRPTHDDVVRCHRELRAVVARAGMMTD